MWAPRVLDLAGLRAIPGLEDLENRACTQVSPLVNPELTLLSGVMEPAIEQVAERVYSALGFDAANSTFVVGDDGIVVIDAMTSTQNMARALLAFREISELPVKGIVYTHHHGDHWAGSPALATLEAAASGEVAVIAQRTLMPEVARINGVNQPVMGARGAYQFGTHLPASPEGRVNVGAGPFLDLDQLAGLVPPTVLVDDWLALEIAGVKLELVWVPSEAPDEIAVWMPELGVLQSADCVQGECYPNLYPLGGDVPRPAAQWVRSLDVLRRYPADALAKSHGRSVVGTEAARDHLRNYRDVIAWTHDQTVRRMNQGYVPDQIVELVGEMPPHLRAYETTGLEGYGSVPHGSRSVYSWYLGYNTGEVTDFDPAPYERRQRGYVHAMGGPARVKELARAAMADGDDKWAIELLGYVVRSDPSDTEARELSAAAHRALGLLQHNATWRNWYLSAAEELAGRIPVVTTGAVADGRRHLSVDSLVAGLPVRLRAELTWYVDLAVAVTVGGPSPRSFTLHLRRGVLEVTEGADEEVAAGLVFTDKNAFVDYLCGWATTELVDAGRLEVTGDVAAAASFAGYFDPAPDMSRILVTLHGPVG